MHINLSFCTLCTVHNVINSPGPVSVTWLCECTRCGCTLHSVLFRRKWKRRAPPTMRRTWITPIPKRIGSRVTLRCANFSRIARGNIKFSFFRLILRPSAKRYISNSMPYPTRVHNWMIFCNNASSKIYYSLKFPIAHIDNRGVLLAWWSISKGFLTLKGISIFYTLYFYWIFLPEKSLTCIFERRPFEGNLCAPQSLGRGSFR